MKWWQWAAWALPFVGVGSVVIGKLIESKVRALLEARDGKHAKAIESAMDELRREMRKGDERGDETEERVDKLQGRVIELETKMGVFWKMIERSTANLLRRSAE